MSDIAPQPPPNSLGKFQWILFGLSALGMAMMVAATPIVFRAMSRVVPENYSFLAQEAVKAGQFSRAESILNSRINKEWYDFHAHYLLAEAQSRAGKFAEAAETMRSTLSKSIAIRGRVRAEQAGYAGFDEAKTTQLLARYLWQAGQPLAASEVWRHAMDQGSSVAYDDVRQLPPADEKSSLAQSLALGQLALRTGDVAIHGVAVSRLGNLGPMGQDMAAYLRSRWISEHDSLTTAAQAPLRTALLQAPQRIVPLLALQQLLTRSAPIDEETTALISRSTGQAAARQATLGQFSLTEGARLEGSEIRMFRNSTVTGKTDTGMFQSEFIVLAATATEAFGQWPVLIVRVQGKELTRLYLDGHQPCIRIIGPYPGGLPKLLELELEYINDAFDPITRSDRDIRIHGIWFQ